MRGLAGRWHDTGDFEVAKVSMEEAVELPMETGVAELEAGHAVELRFEPGV